jgi:protein-disulfide isomerase
MSSTGQSRPTRKEQREQARADRKSIEAQQQQSQARRRRLMQIGGIALVAVVVIGIAVAVGTSSSGSSKVGPTGAHSAEVDKLLAGIPQSGNTLGNPNAPVTMQYFGDLECPICQEFSLGALPTIIEKYVRSGQVKLQFRSMKTATREPTIFLEQQAAALAAGRQNLMWHYVENFYHNQGAEDSGYVTPEFLKNRANEIPGLNVAKWEEARHDPKLSEEVEKDIQASSENGFNGTPSFLLVKGANTKKLESFTTQQLAEASALFGPEIEKLLKS